MARTIRTLNNGRQESINTVEESNGGTGHSFYSSGDILYADGYSSLARLPIGTDGYGLSSVGGLPAWMPAGSGNSGPWIEVAYVDGYRGSGSGTKGDAGLPFKTINAALAACTGGETVWIGPGTYVEDIEIPNVSGLVLKGFGRGFTYIINKTVSPTVFYTGNGANVLQDFVLKDMTIMNTSGVATVAIDGNLDDDLFLTGQLLFDNVSIMQTVGTSSLILTRVNAVRMVNCFTMATSMEEVALLTVRGWENDNKAAQFSYDMTAGTPAGGINECIIEAARLGTVNVSDQANIKFEKDCYAAIITGNLADTVTNEFGQIKFHGTTGLVNVTFDFQHDGYQEGLNFNHAHVQNEFVIGDGGSSTEICVVMAKNAVFSSVTPGNVRAEDFTYIYMENSSHNQASLASAGAIHPGRINRSMHVEPINLTGMAQTVTFSVPFVDPTYMIHFVLSMAAASPVILAIGGQTPEAFDCTSAGIDAGAYFVALMQPA